jgi:hypothetical protein
LTRPWLPYVIRHASSDAERNNPGLCGAGRLTLDTILLTIDLDAVLRGESPVIGTTFVKTPIGLRSLELDTLLPRLIGTGQIRELRGGFQ